MAGEASPETPPLDAFLEQYWKDHDAGRVRSLEEYQAMFPGDSRAIARELRAIEEQDAPPPVRLHARVGPYRVLEDLGHGGQADVYLAEDTRLPRRVALKIPKNWGPSSGSAFLRFRREAEVASRLDHPGICPVYDTGVWQDVPYIAMKYVPGESLARRIETARRPLRPVRARAVSG